jgi:plastocyanin
MKLHRIFLLLAVGALSQLMVGVAVAADNAVIKGKVIFADDPQKPEFRRTVLDTTKDPNCAKGKPRIGSWKVVVNRKSDPPTLGNVIVHVKEGLPDRKWDVPKEQAVLDQHGCEYTPHVLAMMEGQTLLIRNSDPTNHNIHFQPRINESINFTQPRQGDEREVTLKAEEPFFVKCDVHPWMGAYIGVYTHPFFSVTRDEGTFEIKGLPPGKYVLQAWHEEFGTKTMTVEVGSGETKEADFTFKPGE